MALLEWTKDYSVGVSNLDRHHQKLFDMLNRLHDAMTVGKGKDVVGMIVNEMIEYAKYHFGEEEKLMERIKYPGLNEHKNAHKKFLVKAEEYKALSDKGMEIFLSSGVSMFLTDWLRTHIAGMDKKYQNAMNSKGIR